MRKGIKVKVDESAGRKVLHDAKGLSPVIVSIGVNKIRSIVVDRLVAKANADGHPLKFTYDIHYNQNKYQSKFYD